jgi:amidohydrolase
MPVRQGEILISNDNITAYSDGFTIKVYGKNAHTSKPQDGVDAINIAGNIIVALNSIISKDLDPRDAATFSIGKIQGGTSNNIVPDYVELSGMIRATTKESRDIIREKLESISKGIANTFGGDCNLEIREGYPSIFNDEDLTEFIRNGFRTNYLEMIKDIDEKIYKESDINKYIINHKSLLTADDFGYISKIVPSTYYMVGTGDFAPGHSPKFFVDEKYIKLCTRTMTLAALEYLNDGKS